MKLKFNLKLQKNYVMAMGKHSYWQAQIIFLNLTFYLQN